MLLKKHGMPPKDSLNLWFLGFAMALTFEFILTTVCLIRIVYPTMHIVFSYGFPFIFVLPGLTIISPMWGIIGTVRGSPRMLKTYSDLNATLFLFNYPLTLIALQLVSEPVVQEWFIVLLMVNKVVLSFFGSKVRQHFVNPGFAKTQQKLKTQLSDMLVLK